MKCWSCNCKFNMREIAPLIYQCEECGARYDKGNPPFPFATSPWPLIVFLIFTVLIVSWFILTTPQS